MFFYQVWEFFSSWYALLWNIFGSTYFRSWQIPCVPLQSNIIIFFIFWQLTSFQNKLQEDMLIYNVFIEYIQWSQQCLFTREGQINTIYSHLNLIRSAVMTIICACWDGKQQGAENINIDYRDLQSKYMENRIAYFGMKTLNNYTNSVIQKIHSLQS